MKIIKSFIYLISLFILIFFALKNNYTVKITLFSVGIYFEVKLYLIIFSSILFGIFFSYLLFGIQNIKLKFKLRLSKKEIAKQNDKIEELATETKQNNLLINE